MSFPRVVVMEPTRPSQTIVIVFMPPVRIVPMLAKGPVDWMDPSAAPVTITERTGPAASRSRPVTSPRTFMVPKPPQSKLTSTTLSRTVTLPTVFSEVKSLVVTRKAEMLRMFDLAYTDEPLMAPVVPVMTRPSMFPPEERSLLISPGPSRRM